MNRCVVVSRICLAIFSLVFLCSPLTAQVVGAVPGQNINMVSGTQLPGGDPFLQRQNEPSMAVSTRNPQHLLAGANDYRSVDIAFPPDQGMETGDAWLGVFTSLDGGQTWTSTLLPGFPQDQSAVGVSSPLHTFTTGTDPTVRAGTHGLFYYSGLAFNRGNNAPSGVFVATLQDQNNKGNGAGAIQQDKQGAGSPFLYRNATLVDTGTSGQFLDKPWIAVDVPRSGSTGSASCIDANNVRFTSGNVYVFYTKFNGSNNNPSSTIYVVTSRNCGVSWTKPAKVSQSVQLNQGTVAAVDPGTGTVYVFWRQIGNGKNQPDSIRYSYSPDNGVSWLPGTGYTFPAGASFDESVDSGTFREADLPAATVDGSGRVWLAFSQRNAGPLNSSRILVTTLPRGGQTWTTPFVADNSPVPGHQFMPAFTFAYGKLMLTWYDNREDHTKGVLQCPANITCTKTSDLVEARVPLTGGNGATDTPAQIFAPSVSDTGLKVRHTIDVRGALVDPAQFNGSTLAFPSVRISQYTFGSRPGTKTIEQLKFNPPNFPMFSHGTKPFIGDYIDVTALTMLFDPASGKWVFNTQPSNAAVFHATWTDNRDVRPPPVTCTGTPQVCTQNWALYTAVGSNGGASFYDPTQMKDVCTPGQNDNQTGSRNQNVYTARITQGLLVGVKENTKPLVTNGKSVQRAFSVFARNTTNSKAFYRFTVSPLTPPDPNNLCKTDPSGTTGSFFQTIPPSSFQCVNFVDVIAMPRSTVSRSLFVTSTQKYPSINIGIAQINQIGGNVIGPQNGGLQSATAINPDNTNPDITNPDITNPDITNPDITSPSATNPDITNAEVYDPTVTNPDITNPDITNPDITNPDITNPDITNPDITNPDINNMTVTNPDITNPDITNPDITNPDITNPDITNPDINSLPAGGINDVTFKLTNKGNTSASYSAKEFAKQVGVQCCPDACSASNSCPASCMKCQLIAHKTYPTPIANACKLAVETQNIPISNIPNPAFTTSFGPDNGSDDPNSQPNPTVSVSPGEGIRVTLRVFGPVDKSNGTPVKTVGVAGGANSGQQTPATSLTLTTTNLPVAVVGTNYQTNSGISSKLTSVGGVGVTSWKTTVGLLPANITLAPTTGQLSGLVAATPGAYPLTFRVDDSVTPVSNFDLQNLTINVNQLTVAGISAANTNTGSVYLSGNPGDSITVTMNLSNQGPAAASGVLASALTITPTAGGTPLGAAPALSCSPASGPALIPSNTTQAYLYTCITSGGNGFVTFTAGASAHYVNSAASVPATAAPLTSNQITVDTTPPTLNFGGVTPAPNAAGWNNTVPVTVNYLTDDNLSGVASSNPGAPVSFSNQGPNQKTVVTVVDKAGNQAAFTSPAVNIDTIAPVITAMPAPVANAAGWNNTPVTVTFNCVDNVMGIASGVATVTSPITLNTDGKNQSANGACTDVAGNSSNATASGINIDQTAPVIPAVSAIAGSGNTAVPYTAGTWTNQSVTVTFTCTDNLSGPAAAFPSISGLPAGVVPVISIVNPLTTMASATLTAETGGTTLLGNCGDVASNPASAVAFGPIMIDKTAPVLTVSATANNAPYTAGTWTNQDVAVTYACVDNASPNANSGLAPGSPTGSQTFTQETTANGASATGSCTDNAGNVATNAPLAFGPILIDKTPPTVTGSAVTPAGPYTAGTWTNQSPVTVTFACNDALSGPQPGSTTGNAVFAGTTAPTTVQGSCTDVAGNTGNGSFGPVQIDQVTPTITITTPAPAQTFVLNSQIAPNFTCDDGGGDNAICMATPSPLPYVATPVGPGTFSVSAIDDAGNTASASANYTVIYAFSGFQSPLRPAGSTVVPSNSGTFVQGDGIPFQWTLQDANNVFINSATALSTVQAFANSACAGAPDGAVIPLFANGTAAGTNTYQVNGNTFAFTWDTTAVASGCYDVVVTLDDTTQHVTMVRIATVSFTGQATDPAGDATGGTPDLTTATVTTLSDGTAKLSVRFAPGTFDASTTQAEFLLDTDQSSATGSPGSDAGCIADSTTLATDYLVTVNSGFAGNQASIFKATGGCNHFAFLGTTPVTISTDGMDVTFPISVLANVASATTSGPATLGPWNFKLTAASSLGNGAFSGVTDKMPDAGSNPASTAPPQ